MEVIKFLPIDTGFEICHVCLASTHHFRQILFSSRIRLRDVNDAIVLLAGRCHVGHKNANCLHTHGSACTLVADTQDIPLDRVATGIGTQYITPTKRTILIQILMEHIQHVSVHVHLFRVAAGF
jgi:hypothetical protein